MRIVFFSLPIKPISGIFSALLAKRIAEKKEKVAAIKASHKKCVSHCLNKFSAQGSCLTYRAA